MSVTYLPPQVQPQDEPQGEAQSTAGEALASCRWHHRASFSTRRADSGRNWGRPAALVLAHSLPPPYLLLLFPAGLFSLGKKSEFTLSPLKPSVSVIDEAVFSNFKGEKVRE